MIFHGLSIKDDDNSDYGLTNGVYLHGELDDKNGYDLCYTESLPQTGFFEESISDSGIYPIPDSGIYSCEVITCNNEEYEATLYLWYVSIGNSVKRLGLVVKKGDTEYEKDALNKYNERVTKI